MAHLFVLLMVAVVEVCDTSLHHGVQGVVGGNGCAAHRLQFAYPLEDEQGGVAVGSKALDPWPASLGGL